MQICTEGLRESVTDTLGLLVDDCGLVELASWVTSHEAESTGVVLADING